VRDVRGVDGRGIRARHVIAANGYGWTRGHRLVLRTGGDPTGDGTGGRGSASVIPGALFEVMAGCGHWPQYEDTKTFDRLHIDFLLGR